MMEIAAAWELLDRVVRPLADERVSLDAAVGGLLREDVAADADQPAFDRSAVDGYALAGEGAGGWYRLVGEVAAGGPAAETLRPGAAVRVATGAAVPQGADGIAMQEYCELDGGRVRPLRPAEASFIRRRGSDARAGDRVLSRGTLLGAAEIAVLASAGRARPLVAPAPRVAHATTGDEIVACDREPGPGQIRDSNGPLIAALVGAAGARLVAREHWRDEMAEAAPGLHRMLSSSPHVLLISGGAGEGDRDLARALLQRAGFEVKWPRLNIRPGKPLLFATRGDVLAFGLPGNPVSHYVCFHLFVRRVIDMLRGAGTPEWIRALLDAPLPAGDGRETFAPCRLRRDGAGLVATPVPWHNSGHVSALADVQGLVRARASGAPLCRGDVAPVLPCVRPENW